VNWTHLPGTTSSRAVGLRGIYTSAKIANRLVVLTGIGHDDLPMITLPSLGQAFASQRDLEAFVDEFDRRPAPSELSGA
jgi:hypothetical protein